MLPEATPELKEAMDLGISLFAGEAEEGRLDQILRDAWQDALKPLYSYPGGPPTPGRCSGTHASGQDEIKDTMKKDEMQH